MISEKIQLNKTAYLETYLLNNSQEYNVGKKRPFVLVIPGGGYAFTSDREAEPIALKFNSIGFNSGVLWYTVMDQVTNVPHNALIEGAMAIKYIREHGEEWLIDTDNIIVCGFSAGGHLTVQLATRWHQEWLAKELNTTSDMLKVNLAIPCYAAAKSKKIAVDDLGFAHQLIENPNTANVRFFGVEDPTDEEVEAYNILNYIDKHTPPMFIWHTFEDVLVDVSASIELAAKLKEKNVPFELHIFEKGEHGLALCDRTTSRKASHHNNHVIHWFELCEEWLSDYID